MTLNIELPDQATLDTLAQNSDQQEQGFSFPTLPFFFYNGRAPYKSIGHAPYFGGWLVDQEKADSFFDKSGIRPPQSLGMFELQNREGISYYVYGTRTLGVAPIKTKKMFDGRSHWQTLAWVSVLEEDGWVDLGLATLTTKGFQTKFFGEAINEFSLLTKELRSPLGVQANIFRAPVGTWGKDRVTVEVGSAPNTSSITPCSLGAIKDLSAYLGTAYVGKEVLGIMAKIGGLQEVLDWLDATEKRPITPISDAVIPF